MTKKTDSIKIIDRYAGYFSTCHGSVSDKLMDFAKFVPRQYLTLFLVKYDIFRRILNVEGSIVECGVFRGGGLMAWAALSAILEPVNNQRKVIGFDTFSGFPELADVDERGTAPELYKGGLCADSYGELVECIRLYDDNRFLGHIQKVELVKGNVVETIPQYLEENPHLVISLLYLDLDTYAGTKAAIGHLYCRMPKGAIIVFDELNLKKWPGETVALIDTLGIGSLRLERVNYDSVISFAVKE